MRVGKGCAKIRGQNGVFCRFVWVFGQKRCVGKCVGKRVGIHFSHVLQGFVGEVEVVL